MEIFADRFYALLLLITGISHLTQPTKWRDFFRGVFASPFGSFIIAAFTLPVGILVVSAHTHWSWDAHGVVTALGWGRWSRARFISAGPITPPSFPADLHHLSRVMQSWEL